MQLARRGWHLAGKKIIPTNIDGHAQALRLQLIAKDLDIHKDASYKPKWWKKKDKAGGDFAPTIDELSTAPRIIARDAETGTIPPKDGQNVERVMQPEAIIPETSGVLGVHFAEWG